MKKAVLVRVAVRGRFGMYLIVFVMLISSILGLYTQVYALQNARMMSKQTAIAQIMLTWHGVAYLTSGSDVNRAASVDAAGCSMTSDLITLPPAALCADRVIQYDSTKPADTPMLPQGYSYVAYKWRSILYDPDGTQRYVLTFVEPPNGSPAASITQPAISFSVSDMWKQIKKSGAPKTSYGMAEGGVFVTPDAPVPTGETVPPSYALPTCGVANCVPNGSVGLITPI